jgi:hypothetical protein
VEVVVAQPAKDNAIAKAETEIIRADNFTKIPCKLINLVLSKNSK